MFVWNWGSGFRLEHTQIVQWVCDSSSLGAWLCVWAKESTAFHITQTHTRTVWKRLVCEDFFGSAVGILASQNRKKLRDKGGEFFKNKKFVFSFKSHFRTMCSILGVPSSILCWVRVWVHTVAVAVCCVSTRNYVAENTHWFSVPLYLRGSSFFSIRYDASLHGCCCLLHLSENTIY